MLCVLYTSYFWQVPRARPRDFTRLRIQRPFQVAHFRFDSIELDLCFHPRDIWLRARVQTQVKLNESTIGELRCVEVKRCQSAGGWNRP